MNESVFSFLQCQLMGAFGALAGTFQKNVFLPSTRSISGRLRRLGRNISENVCLYFIICYVLYIMYYYHYYYRRLRPGLRGALRDAARPAGAAAPPRTHMRKVRP